MTKEYSLTRWLKTGNGYQLGARRRSRISAGIMWHSGRKSQRRPSALLLTSQSGRSSSWRCNRSQNQRMCHLIWVACGSR